MIKAVILNFEQIGQEEFKTIPYVREFTENDKLCDIIKWIKSINENKTLLDVYFNDRIEK